MVEVLQNLTNLQYIDNRIDELKRMRGDLPEDILDIETEIARIESRIKRSETESKELILEKASLELEITESEGLVTKYEEQQLSVRNNREYDALTKEIEVQKQIRENAQSRLEEIALQSVEMNRVIDESKSKLEETKALLAGKKENLDKLIESTRKEEDELLDKREEAAKNLDSRYLRSYERLRKGLQNGMAVVAIEKGSSLGMMLPPQVQVEVRRKNKIIFDENSGRIVVDPSFFDEAKKQLNIQ
jgi:predicted  nucleic acid-binding Zn-ribbon protein